MIRFRMIKIKVTQFALLKDTPPESSGSIELITNIKHSVERKMIAIEIILRFNSEDDDKKDTFMTLGVQCDFNIHPEDWESCKKETSVVIPKETLDYFLSQTVGVSRGVLHCKTEGTPFNSLVLPPLNVSQVIKKDLCINALAI